MSKIIKQISPQELQNWNVPSDSKIDYYDGKILIVSDAEEDSSFGVAAKAGIALLGGISIFTHAPFVAAVMGVYAAYKVTETVKGLYGGDSDLTTRLAQDLELEVESQALLPIATAYPIGEKTRLDALEIAVDTQDNLTQSNPKRDSLTQPNPIQANLTQSSPTALSIIVSDPYQSRAFFGAQRTGKSYLAAVASRQISESLGCKVFHMNLASYGSEDSYYWTHAIKSLVCDLSSMGGYEATQMVKSAIKLVKEFYSTQNAILIVDEIAYCGSTVAAHKDALAELMRIVADKITTLSSSGKKRRQAIWTIAPEFVAGSLSQEAKAVKKLKLCYVSANINTSLDWQGQSIGFDWELFNQIKVNFTITEPTCLPNEDRVAFIGSEWLPIGELPKLEDVSKNQKANYQEKTVDIEAQTSFYPTPVEHLNDSFNLDSATPDYEEMETAIEKVKDDEFVGFAATLNHDSQASLKSFVLWLGKKQGEEISFKQIEGNWAKTAGISRSKDTLNPLIQIVAFKKFIKVLPNSNYLVADLRTR